MADDVTTVASPLSSVPVSTIISTQQQTDLSHRQNLRLVDGSQDSTDALAIDAAGRAAIQAPPSLPLPTGASTETTVAAILAKLTSDPATQTTLAAILAKIIAAPATEAKQDTGNTSLASILAALASVAVTDGGGSLTVDGTFWQVTQPVSAGSLPLPTGAATESTLGNVLTTSDFDAKVGALTETAPTTDTASSGLNGRLQRIAQRITSLIGSFTFGAHGVVVEGNASSTAIPVSAASLPLPTGAATETTLGGVLTTSDFDSKAGSLTEAAPATDTASSGLNGRLQRIAQRITSLIALIPSALGAHGGFVIEGVASGTAVPVSGSLSISPTVASTATRTTVSGAASDTSLLASNSSRLGAMFFNDSTAILYLALGTTATTSDYTAQVGPGGYYELPTTALFTGAVRGIWSAANGAVKITELTA